MEAGKKTINDIFQGARILEVPFFQRSYVWEEEQWERLLADLEYVSQTGKNYFLGSIILKQQSTPTSSSIGDRRIVIDGQQRLTTLVIFFKVFCLKINQIQIFDNVFRSVIDRKITFIPGGRDIEAFNKIMDLQALEEIKEDDNISRVYNYFREKIDIEKINLTNLLSKLLFVSIDLAENEDEQQIFDTINSLGVKLTTADLLKNYLFNKDSIEEYKKYWQEVFENEAEYWENEVKRGGKTFIDLFFYSFLQIRLQDKNLNVEPNDKQTFSRYENLFSSYKDFIKKYLQDNKKEIAKEIKEYAELFKNNFNDEILEQELPSEAGIDRLKAIMFRLDVYTLAPYVLYILKNVADIAERNKIFEFLESYIMRRIIVKADTKNYNQLFTAQLIGNGILSQKQLVDFFKEQTGKTNFFPSDKELKESIFNSVLNNKQAAGVLYLIETKMRNTQKHTTKLLGFNEYTLEHLMPKKWKEKWNGEKVDPQERNRKILLLGNLAIIKKGLNSSIRNDCWKNKREKLKSFSSGVETLQPFLEYEVWNEQTIDERTQWLYEQASKIWKDYVSL